MYIFECKTNQKNQKNQKKNENIFTLFSTNKTTHCVLIYILLDYVALRTF